MIEGDIYFDSYADLEVHKVMLNDSPRNEAYQRAILSNKTFFEGKIVLDVGAGTGILSVLSAKAGASKVYAVDASDITELAQSIIEENEVQHIIQVIHGRIEDIQLPEKVDIIVSEWMGFYLLHESMLDSVLIARDKFLKQDGLMFPSECKIFAAPCLLPSFYTQWNDVCDVKMKCFASQLRKLYNGKPEITDIPPSCLLSEGTCLFHFSLNELKIEDLSELKSRLFTVSKTNCKCQGICIWFTVMFPSSQDDIILETSPMKPLTHWKQTVLVMQKEIELEENEAFAGILTLRKSQKNSRFYDIEFEILDVNDEEHPIPCQCYFTKCKIINALSAQYDEADNESSEEIS